MSTHQDDSEFEIADERPRGPFQWVASVLAAVGTLWIFVLMGLVVADVAGRNFFDAPLTGVAEFAGRSVVAIVFLQLAAAVAGGRLTRAGFLLQIVERRLPRLRISLDVVYSLVGATLFAVLAYAAWPEFAHAWTGDEFFGVRGVYMLPTWPFRGLIVLGSAMAALAFLLTLPGLLREFAHHRGESS